VLELERPNLALLSTYSGFIAEMRELGETIWPGMVPRDSESAEGFVQRLLRAEHSPEAGLVPESIYWAVDRGIVVGRIALRHHLNESLEEFGGHIGYEARPSLRRRGVAREMLRQLLATPKAREIGRLLVTCAPDNIGSNKTIVANGGALARTAFVERVRRQTNYYWIVLA
jgi:predicted acetyltransferase